MNFNITGVAPCVAPLLIGSGELYLFASSFFIGVTSPHKAFEKGNDEPMRL
jgi:hypothetical protein